MSRRQPLLGSHRQEELEGGHRESADSEHWRSGTHGRSSHGIEESMHAAAGEDAVGPMAHFVSRFMDLNNQNSQLLTYVPNKQISIEHFIEKEQRGFLCSKPSKGV